MARKRLWHSVSIVPSVLVAVVTLVTSASASTESVLYSFSGGSDGGYPDSDLVMDRAGNLYGTSVEGGAFGSGAVFELSPSGTSWTETVLYSFTSGTDGGEPYGGVTLDAVGNLYGTTVTGGSGGACEGGCGVAFKLTNSAGAWTETVIHNFTGGADGSGPGAGLSLGKDGGLYGMTPIGGASGLGVIYELKSNSNGTWGERIIHTFTGGVDGAAGSAGRLIRDAAGNLYGVATVGGAHGDGVVFELTPIQGGSWKLTTLYSFRGQPDAGYPYGALAFDHAGNLYGTTYYGGASNLGAVYKLAFARGVWSETVLYSFKGGNDGSNPISNLAFSSTGDLYGTTSAGGSAKCSCGTVFKLTPAGNGTWTETVAYRFLGAPDAGFVYNGMIAGPAGSYYGTSVHGGVDNEGSVYEFTP